MKAKTKQSAFTLIELLVVIAIIGILATLAVVALQQARQNARDAKRVADVKQISTALELHFNDNQEYPETLEELQTEGYMEQLPEAPTPADEGCEPGENEYIYTVDEERGDYQVSFCIGKQVSDMTSGVLCMTPGGITTNCEEETFGTFVDARDGQEYEWVKIGDQTWMAENLNYDNGCSSVTWVNSSDEGWCGYYENDEVTYGEYGILYQWSAAMNGSTNEGAQGICPSGWHVPSDAEFMTLEEYLGMCSGTSPGCSGATGWRGTNEGSKLAGGYDLWYPGALKSDSDFASSGFNVLPIGVYESTGSSDGLYAITSFWSSSEINSIDCYNRHFNSGPSTVARYSEFRGNGFYVRCLKD